MADHTGHRDRLRKRYLKHSLDTMPDDQALELLLFYAVPRKDTNPLARALLQHFGSLPAVLEASVEELTAVEGIGEQSAILISMLMPFARRYLVARNAPGAILTTTQACGEYLVPYFFGAKNEMLYVLCLDGRGKVLSCRKIQEGSFSSVGYTARKIAEVAMNCNACSIILAHNHTSGLIDPSLNDLDATTRLQSELRPLDIRLADHIIVSGDEYLSLADNGCL